jgi:DNA-binding beta-propeller fold protein YncE
MMIRRLFLSSLCAALGALSLGASGAQAANHPFLFGVSELPPKHPFVREFIEDPCGLTVNAEGNFYVSAYYHENDYPNSLYAFGPGGGFSRELGGTEDLDRPCASAFDAAGNLYLNDFHRDVVKLSAPELTERGLIDQNHPTGLAVEAATGNLFVDDRTYIAEYAAPVFAGEEPIKIGLGSLQDGYGLAVSDFPQTEGYLYAPDAATNTVKVYDPAQSTTTPVEEIDGLATPQGGFFSLTDAAVAIDDSDGHLFVLDQLQHYAEHPLATVDEFNPEGAYRGGVPQLPLIIDGEPSGLTVDNSETATQGRLYVGSGNGEESSVFAYGPTGPAHGLKVTITGAGTVKSQPAGIECPEACSAEFNQAAEVTLSAVPQAGSALAGWSVGGNPATCPGTGSCRVILSSDLQVSAEFEALPPAPAAAAAQPSPAGPAGGVSALAASVPAPGTVAAPASSKRHHHRHKRHRAKR